MFKQARAIALPVTVAGMIPALILTRYLPNPGWGLAAPLNVLPTLAGVALIAAGLYLILTTIGLFVTLGKGTLAPWDPPQKLVVTGIYCYVRNPMISGVVAVLFGQALLFSSFPLLLYAGFVFAANAVYIPLSEEPGLRRRFGHQYDDYARQVPRWLPRRTPYTPE
jgi:protein-S-isoprenylcysteine O-methyltransferase Ste14